MRRLWYGSSALAALVLAGCESKPNQPAAVSSVLEPSPNASILPAPLVTKPVKTAAASAGAEVPADERPEAGPIEPPRALREDEAVPSDDTLREAPGVGMEARFRWLEPAPPKPPEGNPDGMARARDKNAFNVGIELSQAGRMKLTLLSRAFSLTAGAELRARDDRYGFIVMWADQRQYAPLAPGTLRAVFAEARLDVTPLADPVLQQLGNSGVLGLSTQKFVVETSLGRLEIEQVSMPAAGSAGALLCRLLLEFVAASPRSSACRTELVPLRAEYTWKSGEHFLFEAAKLHKRPQQTPDMLATPPLGAEVRRGELPATANVALLDEGELAGLRVREGPAAETKKSEPGAPKSGLLLVNRSESPRYVLVDGITAAWLRPDGERLLTGLKPGRYALQSRDFFGTESTPPRPVEPPARFLIGEEPERER
jgi:hypothetical protein